MVTVSSPLFRGRFHGGFTVIAPRAARGLPRVDDGRRRLASLHEAWSLPPRFAALGM